MFYKLGFNLKNGGWRTFVKFSQKLTLDSL